MSSVRRETSFNIGGPSPETMRMAKPSTTAVLPTPASPVRMGLFWRRRIRMSTTWRISSSRPTMGSSSPLRAFSVRSTENRARASCLPMTAGAMAPLVSPGAAPPVEPSLADRLSSGEPPTIFWNSSVNASSLILANSRESPRKLCWRSGVFKKPMTR